MARMAAWKDWASFFKFNSSVVEKSQKKMTMLSFPLFESFDKFQLEFQEWEKRAENISLYFWLVHLIENCGRHHDWT